MFVKFWGTRGSMPTPLSAIALQQKIRQAMAGAAGLELANPAVLEQYVARLPFTVQQTVGGNTPCLEVRAGDHLLIIDAGSGLRLLGQGLMRQGFAAGQQRADFLITHTHWDHIHGFPFFQPAFIPHNHFTFYSPFPDLAERLNQQQQPIFFPVPLSHMQASLEFRQIEADEWHQIGNLRVYPLQLSHPGLTYGYRIEDGQSCLVIATDSEYQRVDPASTARYVEFFRNADLLVFDAQYSLNEALDKPDWGHSTAIMGAELAHRAGVKRLALSHHDPASSDDDIWNAKEQAEAYLAHRHPNNCEIMIAYDGLNLEI